MEKHIPGLPTQVLLSDVEDLKNPVAHASHWGRAVLEPRTLVYLPAGHLVCVVQVSFDVSILKNPAAHC